MKNWNIKPNLSGPPRLPKGATYRAHGSYERWAQDEHIYLPNLATDNTRLILFLSVEKGFNVKNWNILPTLTGPPRLPKRATYPAHGSNERWSHDDHIHTNFSHIQHHANTFTEGSRCRGFFQCYLRCRQLGIHGQIYVIIVFVWLQLLVIKLPLQPQLIGKWVVWIHVRLVLHVSSFLKHRLIVFQGMSLCH